MMRFALPAIGAVITAYCIYRLRKNEEPARAKRIALAAYLMLNLTVISLLFSIQIYSILPTPWNYVVYYAIFGVVCIGSGRYLIKPYRTPKAGEEEETVSAGPREDKNLRRKRNRLRRNSMRRY
ncbi:hypothetical protein SAMN04487771_100463 [[Clostridium] aminophilum]|uniref:Uncharacterized protein n=1 Tax=[Clostridium] aminophilum TaxID=1526 RepID=A0A1I0BIG9_9FIRM|nr:hypothetical protein [[Clostridium] aminophilum]SET06685.1 hypothetical protein SAMN04487771_100463 [[Clostridium] aminophilum]